MDRQRELDAIKSKPNTASCSCGLEGGEILTCSEKSCKDQRIENKRINKLVESGWLPVNRWRHT